MSEHINKILILALGIAIGVIVMLMRDPTDDRAASTPSTAPSTVPPASNPGVPPNPPSSPNRQVTQYPMPPSTNAKSMGAPEENVDTEAFAAEMARVLDGQASEDEQLAFWQSIQTSKRLDALITDLQDTASADPEDVASRLSLAQAYVTKVWGSPAGPAQGLWASKAEGMWKEVLETDPLNWQAQHSIGFSYSQYPDFLNKTGDAITEYEKTIALQEAAPESRPRFASSYLELAKLHVKNGDPSNALATLEKGVATHPDDADLTKQLQVISSSYKFEDAPDE